MVAAVTNLPAEFDLETGRHVVWRAALGLETYGTPIVAGGCVYIGTNNRNPRDPRRGGDRGVLMCLRESDGTLLWQVATPKIGGDVYLDWPGAGLCSPPTVEGDRVYVLSNRGELLCLDVHGMANGNDGPFREEAAWLAAPGETPIELGPLDADVLWWLDLKKTPGIYPHDSSHASVLIHGDLLYLNTCNGVDNTHRRIRCPDAATLVAVHKATGRVVAEDQERIGPRIVHCQWSSPALVRLNGRDYIVLGGADAVVYVFEALAPRVESVPERPQALRCVGRLDLDPTTVKEGACEWNGRREPGGPSTIHGMPVWANGRLYATVGGDRWWGKRESWLVAIGLSQSGGEVQLRELWRYPLVRQCLSTPAVTDHWAFVPDSSGRLHCVDAETGQPQWVEQLDGEVSGSPLVTDGKVYVGTHRGTLYAYEVGPQPRRLGCTRFESAIWGTPTAANGRLYVATMKWLYALEAPAQASATPASGTQ